MNIACDGRPLLGLQTGVGTWTVNIMGGLARRPELEITLWSPHPLSVPAQLAEAGVRAAPPPRLRLPGTLWLNSLLPVALSAERPDVFVGPLGVTPRRCPVPTIAVVHDLTPRTLPERHTLVNRFCFNAYLEESLLRAEAVVTVSKATRAELTHLFPGIEDRTLAIPNGVDQRYSPTAKSVGDSVRRRFSGGRPYILHLGTLEPRKGVIDLITAWERVVATRDDAPDLVLAGAAGWGVGPIFRRIDRSPIRERIHLSGYVDADDAPSLLQSAELFVLASEGEGFGLPLAEAVCCGTPSVASKLPALLEVADDAALYAAPRHPGELAEAIDHALRPEEQRRLREAALRRERALRWGPAIDAWADLLHATARRSSTSATVS